MVKIYFALGHVDLENYIKSSKPLLEKKLGDTIQFTGAALYREGIIKNIENNPPDILLLREGLSGTVKISDIIYQIRVKFPRIRIIFIAGDRNVGDPLLSTLVNYGIYDILVGNRVNAKDMLRKICTPSTLADVSFLIQKVNIDENTNQANFELPDVDLLKENQRKNELDAANVHLSANDPVAQSLLKSLVEEKEIEEKPEIEKIHENRINELFQDFASPEQQLTKIEQNKREEEKIAKQNIQTPIQEVRNEEPNFSFKKQEETSAFTPQNSLNFKEIKEEIPVSPIRPIQSFQDGMMPTMPQEQIFEAPKATEKSTFEHYKHENQEFLNKQIQTVQGNDTFNIQVLKESAKYSAQFSQKVITFLGGNRGVGNTQLAFNTALNIAMSGKKTLYIDVNPVYCYSDALYQLSFENMGLNTALRNLEIGNLIEIERSIATTSKLMSFVANNSNLAKIYNKFPSTFDFLTFSQEHLTKKNLVNYDVRYFNQLIEFLITKLGYEMIVIDTVCDIYNDLSVLAILNSHKVIATISQDYAVLTNFINMMRYLDREAIDFRNKTVFVLNRFQKHTITAKTVYSLLENNLNIQAFQLITLPDIYLDFLTANSSNLPIMWCTKDKTFIHGMQEIIKNI